MTQPQPSPAIGHPQTPPMMPAPTSGLAIASLVCGIASLFALILTGIPAIICGHMALGKIKRAGGQMGGSSMAITGLVLGYISIALTLVIAVIAAMATPVILKQQKKAQLVQATSNAKQLFYCLIDYDEDFGGFPENLEQLESEGHVTDLTIYAPAKGEDWIYFPGQSLTDHAENILLASPTPIDNKRAVLRIDGSVKHMRETEYQSAIKAQQNRPTPNQ